jgi:tripartite-type tricarboxylate transporter receptor subunit TctC
VIVQALLRASFANEDVVLGNIMRAWLSAFWLAGIAISIGLTGSAAAETWPARSVTVIVPLGAGGNTDMMARLGTEHLIEKFSQPFVVENRPSAGGAVGTGQVATANPDGYMLLFAPASMVLLTPQLQKLTYDPMKQLVPITNIGTGTQTMAIRRDLPVTTLPEFIAYAKANPGKLNFTTAGTQNISQLAPALLFAKTGIDLVMVPAKSGPQAVSDLMSGQIDVYFGNSSELLPHINSDRIRLLAVGTPQRLAAAPDLPTVAETVPGFEFSSWNGFSRRPEPRSRSSRRCAASSARSPNRRRSRSASPASASCLAG